MFTSVDEIEFLKHLINYIQDSCPELSDEIENHSEVTKELHKGIENLFCMINQRIQDLEEEE
jgi:SMC interacting uncharacterized protein involved in chromosome segregation